MVYNNYVRMNYTMNLDRFDQKRKLLDAHQETQLHHAEVLNRHFTSIDIGKFDESLSVPTAFATPNDLYKEKIHGVIKEKQKNINQEE